LQHAVVATVKLQEVHALKAERAEKAPKKVVKAAGTTEEVA
jgi:hypothetical protein